LKLDIPLCFLLTTHILNFNTTAVLRVLKQQVNLIAVVSLFNMYCTWINFYTMQLHFYNHVDHTDKQTLKLLGLLQYNISYSYTTDGFTHVYCALLQSKFEFAFVLTASFAIC